MNATSGKSQRFNEDAIAHSMINLKMSFVVAAYAPHIRIRKHLRYDGQCKGTWRTCTIAGGGEHANTKGHTASEVNICLQMGTLTEGEEG